MEMKTKKVQVSGINPAPFNPRVDLKPGDEEYESLRKSIEEFGYVEPLVWNERTKTLISGHQRLKVLKAKGVNEVEVSTVDLSPEKEKVLNIALNKIKGRWDKEKLALILDELVKLPDFDVASTGFTQPELSQLFDRYLESRGGDDFDFQSAVDSIKQPVTKGGDLIKLGHHRIMCGDATNPEHLKVLMNGEKADITDCDFPYNVNLGGGDRPNAYTRPKKSRKWPQIYSDNMPQEKYEAWMRTVLTNIKQFLKSGGVVYFWQGHRQLPPMYQILLELDFHISCLLFWLKEHAVLTYGDYSFRTEQCLYGWLKGAPHYWAGKPGSSNVWEISRDSVYLHPAQKPVQLAQNAIMNSSKINGIILDVFLGSGSVLLGATILGRRCYGLEIDPRYCDAIVRRYIAYVGKDKVSSDIVERYLKED
jgi:DNA modification methylase